MRTGASQGETSIATVELHDQNNQQRKPGSPNTKHQILRVSAYPRVIQARTRV